MERKLEVESNRNHFVPMFLSLHMHSSQQQQQQQVFTLDLTEMASEVL